MKVSSNYLFYIIFFISPKHQYTLASLRDYKIIFGNILRKFEVDPANIFGDMSVFVRILYLCVIGSQYFKRVFLESRGASLLCISRQLQSQHLRRQLSSNEASNLVLHISQKCLGKQGSGGEYRQEQAIRMDEIAKSGVRLSSDNVTDIDKPMHCLYDDLNKSMARKVKI